MKLSLISEDSSKYQTFYKGMLGPKFEEFKKHRIPGFLSDLHMALVYADPKTMGNQNVPRVIISCEIDTSKIQDMQHRVEDMCGAWQSPKDPRYNELRSSIWWSNSGGHGKRGIYCGQPVDYKIVFSARNMEEYYKIISSSEILKRLAPHDHIKSADLHWSDYNNQR